MRTECKKRGRADPNTCQAQKGQGSGSAEVVFFACTYLLLLIFITQNNTASFRVDLHHMAIRHTAHVANHPKTLVNNLFTVPDDVAGM